MKSEKPFVRVIPPSGAPVTFPADSFGELMRKAKERFSLKKLSEKFYYSDSERDWITVSNQRDLEAAYSLFPSCLELYIGNDIDSIKGGVVKLKSVPKMIKEIDPKQEEDNNDKTEVSVLGQARKNKEDGSLKDATTEIIQSGLAVPATEEPVLKATLENVAKLNSQYETIAGSKEILITLKATNTGTNILPEDTTISEVNDEIRPIAVGPIEPSRNKVIEFEYINVPNVPGAYIATFQLSHKNNMVKFGKTITVNIIVKPVPTIKPFPTFSSEEISYEVKRFRTLHTMERLKVPAEMRGNMEKLSKVFTKLDASAILCALRLSNNMMDEAIQILYNSCKDSKSL